MSKTLGQVAFEALVAGYDERLDHREWPEMQQASRDAWQAAAEAVARVAWAEGCCAGAYAQEDLQQDVDDLVNPYEALQEARDET